MKGIAAFAYLLTPFPNHLSSWSFLSSDRPYHNASCTDTFDTWRYGLGQNTTKIVKYARKDVEVDKNAIVQRYLARKVHMALGLL